MEGIDREAGLLEEETDRSDYAYLERQTAPPSTCLYMLLSDGEYPNL